jgi:hypothetical protein
MISNLPANITSEDLTNLHADIVLALESILPTDQLLDFWDITADQLAAYSKQPDFKQSVARLRKDMLHNGTIARAAAMKALSENAHRIGQRLSDPELGHGAFATLMNQAYQISGMKGEDSRRRDGPNSNSGQINIQINLNGEKQTLSFDQITEDGEFVE